MSLPLIAIVGAPNVGKSTLFNRLVGGRRAIVTDEPGVTRDRMYGEVRDAPIPFRVVDTGGLTPQTDAPFAREIEQQADAALDEAAVVLFVVDARAGATALELELADLLRRRGKPLVLVANKVDGPKAELLIHDLHALRLGEPVAVSAEHGRGIDELFDRVGELLAEHAAESPPEDDEEETISVAIVGRPNVGKSSLLNRLVGAERAVVSDVAGTTRDSVDTLLTVEGRHYRLIDTAGIRRPGKVRLVAERFSVGRARRNIERCDAAVLVLDGSQPFAAQDAHIAGHVREAAKPMVVAVNKWDLVSDKQQAAADWEDRIRHRLRFAREVPIVRLSAKTGQRVPRVLALIDRVHAEAGIRVPTGALNRWVSELGGLDGRTASQARGFNLLYATQTGVHPPRFVVFCNDPRLAHFSLRRHLENSLRERFGFGSAPIRLAFRGRRDERS